MKPLWPHQVAALDGGDGFPGVIRALETARSTLIVAATGSGKSRTACELAVRRRPLGRILFLADRKKLVRQFAERARSETPLSVGVEMADDRVSPLFLPDLVCASIQTLSRPERLAAFAPDAFATVLVDEADLAIAESYRAPLDHFAAAKVVGMTATPVRADGKRLEDVFETRAHVFPIRDAIEADRLCRIVWEHVEIPGLDLSACRTTAGDLNARDLEAALLPHAALIAAKSHEIAGPRLTMIFTPTVKMAEIVAAALNEIAAGCARSLDGTMDADDEQEPTLRAFEAREFRFLVSCDLLVRGVDIPPVDCVVLARHTKSWARLVQMTGRGTRKHPGKANLLLVDVGGNTGRHSLAGPLDVLDGTISSDVRRRAERKCAEGEDILTALDEAEHEIGEERRRAVLAAAQVRHSATIVDPFAMVQAFLGVALEPGRRGGQPATADDLAWMAEKAHGIDPRKLDGGQVQAIRAGIEQRRAKGLCSWNIARVLIRAGCDPDVTMAEGMALMQLLAANRWQPTPAAARAMAAHTAHAEAVRTSLRSGLTSPGSGDRLSALAAVRAEAFRALGGPVSASSDMFRRNVGGGR